MGVFGAFLIAFFSKRLTWEKFKRILIETGATTSSVLLLLCSAKMFTKIIALSGMVNWLNGVLISSGISIITVIIIVLIITLGLGCIIDSSSIFLLVLPMMAPILIANDINMIWFGVVFTIVTEMGLITPPFGVCVFTVKSALGDKVRLEEIFSGVMPYLIGMAGIVILLFCYPVLAIWLPGMM